VTTEKKEKKKKKADFLLTFTNPYSWIRGVGEGGRKKEKSSYAISQ